MRSFLFLIVFLLPFTAFAQDTPEGLYLCSKDSDCIVVEDFCPNNWRAIAKGQEKIFEQWGKDVAPYVECNVLKPSAKPGPECDGNRCIVHSPVPGKK